MTSFMCARWIMLFLTLHGEFVKFFAEKYSFLSVALKVTQTFYRKFVVTQSVVAHSSEQMLKLKPLHLMLLLYDKLISKLH